MILTKDVVATDYLQNHIHEFNEYIRDEFLRLLFNTKSHALPPSQYFLTSSLSPSHQVKPAEQP